MLESSLSPTSSNNDPRAEVSQPNHVSSSGPFDVSVNEEQPAPESDHQGQITVNSVGAAAGSDGHDTSDNAEPNFEVMSYLKHLSRLGAELSCFFAALVLGSFASFMPWWNLWICLAYVLLKLLMDFSIRPSWAWLISYLSTRSTQRCPACRPIGLNISAADRARGDSSTVIIKCTLSIVLLVKSRNLGLSDGCSEPPCSERAKESMRALAVMVMVLEGLPFLLIGAVQASSGRAGIKRMKRSYHLVRHALHKLRTDSSLTWWQLALILQSFHASASSAVLVSTASLLVGGNFGNFMTARCFWLCALVVLIELLAEKAGPTTIQMFRYFRVRNIGQPSLATHTDEIQQNEEQQNTPLEERTIASQGLGRVNDNNLIAAAKAKLLLRVPVHGILCIWLSEILHRKTYYPKDLDTTSCDYTCEKNTKVLLTVVCIFTGSQAASILPLWAPWQILAALLPGFVPFRLFSIVTFAFPALFVSYTLLLSFAKEWASVFDQVLDVATTGCLINSFILVYWNARQSPRLQYFILLGPAIVGAVVAFAFRYQAVSLGQIASFYPLIVTDLYVALRLRSEYNSRHATG